MSDRFYDNCNFTTIAYFKKLLICEVFERCSYFLGFFIKNDIQNI